VLRDNWQMKNGFPLVSVIIPAYNTGRFIEAAIESALRQTYPEEFTEIIAVDDGSTDNTSEILKGYGKRIVYIHQENRGIASARNRGMAVTKGEIITFLDADDLWHRDRLKKVADTFLEKDRIEMVYHPIALIDSGGFMISENFLKAFGYREGVYGRITKDIITGKIFCGGSSFAFRREILKRVSPLPEDIRRGVDYYMTVLASCDVTAGYIPEILGAYRSHEGNISMFAGFKDSEELSAVYKDFAYTYLKLLEKVRGSETSKWCTWDINTLEKMHARNSIVSCILNGRRSDAVKLLPLLFRKGGSPGNLLSALGISLMTLLSPGALVYKLLHLNAMIRKSKLHVSGDKERFSEEIQ